ncbi:MAG: peroxide stress protein YaaA [Pseudomonadota bacterium]
MLSPAKSLDFQAAPPDVPIGDPVFRDAAAKLARSAARLSRVKLKAMMALSDDLADLNWRRFKAFEPVPGRERVKQAALAFAGDTYAGLRFSTLSPEDMAWANDHIAILSGLYGVLRPLDAIQPYRLEMGRRLKTGRAETLYDFWGARLAAELDARAAAAGAKAIVNCASTEYFRAARADLLKTPVITPVFLDEKAGEAKVISFFAKRARGALARYVVQTRATAPTDLQHFAWEGYRFDAADSTDAAPVFRRPEAVACAS